MSTLLYNYFSGQSYIRENIFQGIHLLVLRSCYTCLQDFKEGLHINELNLKLVSVKEDMVKLCLNLSTHDQRTYV